MENFNLVDFIAKLGNAYLNSEDKKTENSTFQKGKTEPQQTTSAPKPRHQSDNEKAIIEMLRNHDKKSREIDEKNKQQ